MFLQPCTTSEIKKIINKIPNKNSSDYDGVSNVLVKELSNKILEPLMIIFNESSRQGIFPTKMKLADIVPLFKSGSRNISSNYRPISLLITLSKILEKIMCIQIYSFLNKDQIYTS